MLTSLVKLAMNNVWEVVGKQLAQLVIELIAIHALAIDALHFRFIPLPDHLEETAGNPGCS